MVLLIDHVSRRDQYHIRGGDYFQKGDLESAAQVFQNLIEEYPVVAKELISDWERWIENSGSN